MESRGRFLPSGFRFSGGFIEIDAGDTLEYLATKIVESNMMAGEISIPPPSTTAKGRDLRVVRLTTHATRYDVGVIAGNSPAHRTPRPPNKLDPRL